MSRSRRKHPIMGHTKAESDRPYKKQLHRKERARAMGKLRQVLSDPELESDGDTAADLRHTQVRFNSWASDKDGKQYYNHPETYRK